MPNVAERPDDLCAISDLSSFSPLLDVEEQTFEKCPGSPGGLVLYPR